MLDEIARLLPEVDRASASERAARATEEEASVWRDGFREETKRRGFRPDRHEVWTTTAREICALEAVRHVVFIEAIIETVKEALLGRVELAGDAARDSEERTVRLLKALDLVH